MQRFQVRIENEHHLRPSNLEDAIDKAFPVKSLSVTELWQPAEDTMAGKLNRLGIVPTIEKGRIVGLQANLWFGGTILTKVDLGEQQFRWMGIDPDDIGHLEADPDGADRGGYHPRLTAGPILTVDGWAE